jgi:hypothetical protein
VVWGAWHGSETVVGHDGVPLHAIANKIVGHIANVDSVLGNAGIPEAHPVRNSSSKRIAFRVCITQGLAVLYTPAPWISDTVVERFQFLASTIHAAAFVVPI